MTVMLVAVLVTAEDVRVAETITGSSVSGSSALAGAAAQRHIERMAAEMDLFIWSSPDRSHPAPAS
jgi:hypothetical protein